MANCAPLHPLHLAGFLRQHTAPLRTMMMTRVSRRKPNNWLPAKLCKTRPLFIRPFLWASLAAAAHHFGGAGEPAAAEPVEQEPANKRASHLLACSRAAANDTGQSECRFWRRGCCGEGGAGRATGAWRASIRSLDLRSFGGGGTGRCSCCSSRRLRRRRWRRRRRPTNDASK